MKRNVGGADQAVRAILGSSLLAAALIPSVSKSAKKVFYSLSAIALGTALTGYCPANAVLGLNSATGSH